MKSKFGVIALMIGLAVLLSDAPASAQGPAGKVGFVDLREIIATSEAGKLAAADFKKTFEKRRASIQSMEADLKKRKDELEKQRSIVKEEVLREKELDYQKHYRDYQRLVADSNEELSTQDQLLSKRIIPEVMRIVNTFGEKEGYTLILDINNPIVVYHSKANNITKRIVAEMNKNAGSKRK
jgi:outer membrane protein